MRNKLAYGLVLLLAAWIISGCNAGMQVTNITATSYILGSSAPVGTGSTGSSLISTSHVWFAWNSAVLLQPHLPEDVGPDDLYAAYIEVPVIPQRSFYLSPGPFEDQQGPYLVPAAYQVLHPTWDEHIREWLTQGEPTESVHLRASKGKAQTLLSASDATVYFQVRFDITDIVQAWYQGEPNYGLVIVPLARSEQTETSGWKHTENPPSYKKRVISVCGDGLGNLYPCPHEEKVEIEPQTMKLVIVLK